MNPNLTVGSRWRQGRRILRAVCVSAFLLAGRAWAGMPGPPSFKLTKLTIERLHVMSFFVAVFLIMSLAFMLLWRSLRKTFTSLPNLTYGRASAIVGLWAAVFVLILTMISGARELMTPGAWQKSGAIYKLNEGV